MIFYIYDEKTKELIGTQNGFIDPLETKKQGKKVYLVPANATDKKPPKTEENQAVIFNGDEWEVVADYRGKTYYIGTEQHEMKKLGELPNGATFDPVKSDTDIAIEQAEQELDTTENRISQIKDELLTATLLDDTDTITALKAEYKELINE